MQLNIKKTLDMTNQMKKRDLSLKKIKHVYFHPQGCLLVCANTSDGTSILSIESHLHGMLHGN